MLFAMLPLEVLKEAQDLGYAERNPEADVEGYDACRKIAILTSIISRKMVDFEEIYTEGISKITDNEMLTSLRTAAKVLDEQRAYAQSASCYSGAPESATETTTKYVMRTEEVQNTEDEDDTTQQQPEKESLWDRIKGLF